MTTPAPDSSSAAAPGTLRTTVGIAGLGLMAGGFWMAWPPLALIVPGALLFTLAVAGAVRAAKVKEN